MDVYEGIVEVRQVGLPLANKLLEQGYRLLCVEAVARGIERENNPTKGLGANFFVAKSIEYVIGRTAEQPSIIDLLTQWNTDRQARIEADRARQTSQPQPTGAQA